MTPSPAPSPWEGEGFGPELHRALRSRPRSIAPKYFYDAAGSALFGEICGLPEYYPTRTELELLRRHGAAMAALMGPHAQLIEYGAGALTKVRLLLAHLERPAGFVPVDICGPHLLAACAELRCERPELELAPLVTDFTAAHELPTAPPGSRRCGFFPGSSIGNFDPEQTLDLLRMFRHALRGGGLLIGIDLIKEPALLHAAYNDAAGVTARFNLNLLERARRELGARFDADGFAHSAFYNAPLQRIEMHLMSRRPQSLWLDGSEYRFEAGETLHTENSYKYSLEGFQALAGRAGFRPAAHWCDPRDWFALLWLESPQ